MGTMASQITSLTIVYSAVYSGADQTKHQRSMSLAFERGIHRGPVNSPHKWPVTRKIFPFDDVIMIDLDYNMLQNRRRTIIWTCTGLVCWCIFVLLRFRCSLIIRMFYRTIVSANNGFTLKSCLWYLSHGHRRGHSVHALSHWEMVLHLWHRALSCCVRLLHSPLLCKRGMQYLSV